MTSNKLIQENKLLKNKLFLMEKILDKIKTMAAEDYEQCSVCGYQIMEYIQDIQKKSKQDEDGAKNG